MWPRPIKDKNPFQALQNVKNAKPVFRVLILLNTKQECSQANDIGIELNIKPPHQSLTIAILFLF